MGATSARIARATRTPKTRETQRAARNLRRRAEGPRALECLVEQCTTSSYAARLFRSKRERKTSIQCNIVLELLQRAGYAAARALNKANLRRAPAKPARTPREPREERGGGGGVSGAILEFRAGPGVLYFFNQNAPRAIPEFRATLFCTFFVLFLFFFCPFFVLCLSLFCPCFVPLLSLCLSLVCFFFAASVSLFCNCL